MLNNWKFGQHFCVVHLDHALVDLRPTSFDARNIKQDGAVLPERPLFDIVNEPDSAEVHITMTLALNSGRFSHISRIRRGR